MILHFAHQPGENGAIGASGRDIAGAVCASESVNEPRFCPGREGGRAVAARAIGDNLGERIDLGPVSAPGVAVRANDRN